MTKPCNSETSGIKYSLDIKRDSGKNVENIKFNIISGKTNYNYGITYTMDFINFFNGSFNINCGDSIELNSILQRVNFPLKDSDNLYIFLHTLPYVPKDLSRIKEISYEQRYRQFSGFYTSDPTIILQNLSILSAENVEIPISFGEDAAFADAKFSKINIIRSKSNNKLYFVYNYKSIEDKAIACFLNGKIFKFSDNAIGILKNVNSGFLISVDISRASTGQLKCIVGDYESGGVNFSATRLTQSVYIINDYHNSNVYFCIFLVLTIFLLYIIKKARYNYNSNRSP